jgi:hypothetical protein
MSGGNASLFGGNKIVCDSKRGETVTTPFVSAF